MLIPLVSTKREGPQRALLTHPALQRGPSPGRERLHLLCEPLPNGFTTDESSGWDWVETLSDPSRWVWSQLLPWSGVADLQSDPAPRQAQAAVTPFRAVLTRLLTQQTVSVHK